MSYEELRYKYTVTRMTIGSADMATPEEAIESLKNIRERTSELKKIAKREILGCKDERVGMIKAMSNETARMFSEFRGRVFEKYKRNEKVMIEVLSRR